MAKDPIGEIMHGRANPDGLHSYGSDAHLAAMREQARQDEARARNFRASGGRQGGARQSRGGFGSLLVMAIVGFFIWNVVKNNDATPGHTTSDAEEVARTPPFPMQNSIQPVPQPQPQPSSPDMKRIEYERQNQPDWERRLGPVRVRTIKASLPEGFTDTDYLTALEQGFVHFHAHVLFQSQHQDQWEERVGKPRLIELKQGLAQGPLGLTDYLDRLEQAAKQ
jgi:hypothetical protein